MKSYASAVLAVVALSCTGGLSAKEADVIWPAEAIKWEDGPAKGTHVAKLWGDFTKGGQYGVLVKFDAGVMHAMHYHTHALKLVIVSGTLIHHAEGGKEVKLGPGSYLLQGGRNKHTSGCAAGADCTFLMTSDKKFDFVDDKPAAKK